MTQSYGKTFKIRKTQKPQRVNETQQLQEVMNLKDLRLEDGDQNEQELRKSSIQEGNDLVKIDPQSYKDDEEDLNCCRFPHSKFCGCESNCLIENFSMKEVCSGNLYYGNFVSGLKTKDLLDLGITHILNITSRQYTKRKQYFEYLNIDLHNTSEQDVKKFFRLSNRFIKNALSQEGKVFIHCADLELGAVMSMGFLIGILKIPFKQGLQNVMQEKMEISPHFMKQIESYDLEKMAFVSLTRE